MADDNGDQQQLVVNAPPAQLQLYQPVPLHVDNLYPYTRSLPFHTVPSPVYSNEAFGISNPKKSNRSDQLVLHLDGNIDTSLYTLQSQPDTCIQWRLLSDRRSLELRPLRWINNAEAEYVNEQAASVISTWHFASPLLGSIVIADHVDSHGNLVITIAACSIDGVIYRLRFGSVWDISSASINANTCTTYYQTNHCRGLGSNGKAANDARQPAILNGLGSNLLTVGCMDSTLIWLKWKHIPDHTRGDLKGYINETVSSPSGVLRSVTGLIPRLLRRGTSGADGHASDDGAGSTHLVSFALAQMDFDGNAQYAVTLSRDRKLRFWSNLHNTSCQHEELLPQLDNMGSPIPIDPHGSSTTSSPPPLDRGTHNYIRIVTHSADPSGSGSVYSNVFGVLVFVPDEATPYFTLLQAAVDRQGRISSVENIMYKTCKATNGANHLMADDELVDFQLARQEEMVNTLMEGPGGRAIEEEISCPYWTLWALWERSSESVLTYTYFSLQSDAVESSARDDVPVGFQFEGHPLLGERWYTVLSQRKDLKPSTDGPGIKEMEALLANTAENSKQPAKEEDTEEREESTDNSVKTKDSTTVQVSQICQAFLDHLFHPIRYDRGVLEHSLGLYESSARERGYDFPTSLYRATSASPHLRQRVATVIGSFLRIQTSCKDGTMMIDEYHRALFTEWMRYLALCTRIQRAANKPKSLSLCRSTNMVCVVTSNHIGILQAAGEIEWMNALTQRDPGATVLLGAPQDAIAQSYPDLARVNARVELSRLLSATTYLKAALGPDGLSALAKGMTNDANGSRNESYETRAAELFEKYVSAAIQPKHLRHVGRLLGMCKAPGDTIRNLLRALVESTNVTIPVTEANDPQSFKSSQSMEGLFTAGFTISTTARFELSLDLALLLIAISYYSEDLESSVGSIASMSSLLAASSNVFALFAAWKWVTSQSTISHNEEPASVEDSVASEGFLHKFSVLNINRRRRDSASSIASKGTDSAPTPQQQLQPTAATEFVYSKLHDIINRDYVLRFGGSTGVFADMVSEGIQQIFVSLGFAVKGTVEGYTADSAEGICDPINMVLFAAKLERTGSPELTEAFLRLLPKSTATSYLNGLVALKNGDYSDAMDLFASAGVAYMQADDTIREKVDLQHVLPQRVLESGQAFIYYKHVAGLFESVRQFRAVSRFGHLAIQALREDSDLPAAEVREQQQSLWFQIFHAEVERDSYEQAYVAMMANSDQKLQLDCLRHLTGILCERKGGVAILCRLSFPGLQEEVERNLLFKARHSDLMAEQQPNYYRILYSFHVYRGNYRNAASAMYQYARRLSDLVLRSNDVAQVLVEQGQALLACINGLSLVDQQFAWVVVGGRPTPTITGSNAEPLDRPEHTGTTTTSPTPTSGSRSANRKRRRIAIDRYDTCSASDGNDAAQDIEIVELEDVRREYSLCMARITLGTIFQELFSRNVLLEPEDVVALYVKTGKYDSAVLFAKEFKLKLDYIFSTLVQKCLELASIKSSNAQHEQTPEAFWENTGIAEMAGTPSVKAWKLLQCYLDAEEPSECMDQRYRLLVAESILQADNESTVLAPWLSSLLLQRCPQDLVRVCLRNGCISEGGEFLLQHINALCNRIAYAAVPSATTDGKRSTRELWLPYQLLDQTMGILNDAVTQFKEAVEKIKDAQQAINNDDDEEISREDMAKLKSLYKSYQERLEALQRLRSDLDKAVERYMTFAARESRGISESLVC